MAELIEMPFGLRTRLGSGNHALDGSPDRPMRRRNFGGKCISGHVRRHSAVGCAKMTEPMEMMFGLWVRVGSRKHIYYVGCTLAAPGE